MLTIFYFIYLFSITLIQQNDSREIIDKVKGKFEKVHDYQVSINIAVDMEFLKIPNVSAKIFFMKPDKMKVESNDFAVLPKEAINFSPVEFLKNNFKSIYVKSDTLQGSLVDVIKIIPMNDSSNIILSTLWIDCQESVVRRIETTTKSKGTFSARLDYGEMIDYGLPSNMIFNFNISDPQIGEIPDMAVGSNNEKQRRNRRNLVGIIVIEYSDYIINRGIDDSLFIDK